MANTQTGSWLAGRRTHIWLGIAFLTLVYVSLACFTKPLSYGDTIVYAPDIVGFSAGRLSSGQFWDFGHLFWRPIGYLIWRLGGSYWAPQYDGDKVLQVYASLRLPNLLLSYFGALAAFGIAWRISRNALTSALIAAAFLGWNPNVNYFQSGTAYIPGLALQLVGLYLLLDGSHGGRSRKRAWAAGAALALSVCLWFPYLLSLPGAFLLAYLWDRNDPAWSGDGSRTRLRWLAHAIVVCALIGVASYATGMSLAGVRSVGQLKAWVAESGHGTQVGMKYLRVMTGLPRAMVEIGNDGLVLKRFVTKDPYAPVGVRDLLFTGLWKLLLFYAGMAALIWTLLRDREARPVRLPFFVGGGLVLFSAVVLFEPSQSERWMPAFPVFLAAVAFVFRSRKSLRLSVLPLAAMLAAFWISNVAAHATAGNPGLENPAVARLLQLKPLLAPHSITCLLSFRDEISGFTARFPFHTLNRNRASGIYYVTEPGTVYTAAWRRDFASRGLRAWKENGDIWISKRLVAERPLPAWRWAEGDDPNLKWRDLAVFFRAYGFDGEAGGPDGFLRIARSPGNQARLEAAAQQLGGVH